MDTFIQFGLVAAHEAFNDSGLEVNESNAERIGTSIGSGIGGVNLIEQQAELLKNRWTKKNISLFVPGTIINMVAGNLFYCTWVKRSKYFNCYSLYFWDTLNWRCKSHDRVW